MGRGLGDYQLKALDWLRQVPDRTLLEITTAVLGKSDLTPNEVRTLRRAVSALEKRKLIKRNGLNKRGQECWTITSRARLRSAKPLRPALFTPTVVK